MDRLLKKMIAVILVVTLAGANFSLLGMYGITYALTDAKLAEQTTKTENANVEFNAYFEGGGHKKTASIDTTEKLFVNIKVKNAGYLKNGIISFQDVNFNIHGDINHDSIQSIDKENNRIVLNQLNSGSDVTLEIPIAIQNSNQVAIDYFVKESKTKFTGTYINGDGKEKSVSKEIINQLSWNGSASAKLETQLTKYIPYALEGKYGVMLQAKIHSSIVDSKLPIKKTQINVQVPEINGVKPTAVNVIATHTKATNGKIDGVDFSSGNYIYDAESGKVQITTTNLSDKIMWLKNAQDEYLVTFIFEGQEIYQYASTNGVDTQVSTDAKIEVYNNGETTITHPEIHTQIARTEKLGTIADFDVTLTDKISKGQIYVNYDSTVKKETPYSLQYIATISSSDLTDKIEFIQSVDKFITAEEKEGPTTVSDQNYTYNKKVKISEQIFQKILGEEGSIDICKQDKTKIGTINKDTTVQDGNYVLDISDSNCNQLYIITSKPITEGQLIIDIEKAVKTNIGYGKSQVKTFEKMETSLQGKASTSTVTASNQMLLKEPTTVASVAISKRDLTTVVKNENVEIRATLNTSNIYHALYKNPTLKITLPSHISDINIKKYDILMANGLKIKGTPKVSKENGSIVITIQLEGKQKEYTIDAEYEGTIIVLNTDITVKTLTPSNTNKITMEFTNANEEATNTRGIVEAKLNFVAPTGIVAANGIINFADGKNGILSISDKSVVGEISAYAQKRTVTIYGKIINNYANSIGNVAILGRLPIKDNKQLDGQNSLGSTFSTTLNSNITLKGIDASKYTVYYSENAEATADLSNESNGWSTTATTGAKSYLIITNGYEMPAGGMIEFSYNVEVPANLKHNNTAYQMYKVYYNNHSSIGRMTEAKTSSIVGLSTGQGPELTAELASTAQTVREGQIIKMNVTVKNTGSTTATNVKVNVPLPKSEVGLPNYIKFINKDHMAQGTMENDVTSKVLNIGTMKPGETKNVSYFLRVDDHTTSLHFGDHENLTKEQIEMLKKDSSFPKKFINQVTIVADELSGSIPSNECQINIQEGKIELDLSSTGIEEQVWRKGNEIEYIIDITNISGQGDLNNTIVTIPLTQAMKYKNAFVSKDSIDKNEMTGEVSYIESNHTVQVKVGTLEIHKQIILKVEVQEFEGSTTMMARAVADGTEEHYSNIIGFTSEIVDFAVSELTATPKYVKEGEIVTYTLKLTNQGKSKLTNINVSDVLPSDLEFVEATYTYAGKEQLVTTSRNGKVELPINQLGAGDSTTIKIMAKAKLLSDKNDKEVQNKVIVSAKNVDTVTTNTVTNIIEYNEKAHNPDEENPNNPELPANRYKITGTAWLDTNKNGKRDTDEELLSNIPVMLLNKKDNSVVKDPDTKKEKKVTTGDNGKYEFSNLPQGEYIVIFLYDASRYSLTTYQEKEVDSSLNSDAININITIDGKRTIAGTTDVITISNDHVRDIDIGLYSAEKFDLKLEKYISKITLTTPTIGTKTYQYDKSKIAKVEVLGQNLGKSNIVIEYKIAVTNEGAVAGYAKKIVDYLPKNVGFNTELNKDWYLSENGNVYNASLANEIIQPGETKEVTLILTKKITEESLGNPINNNAEIFESYNEQGLQDIDSTPGNKVQEEDDMSEANIILSLVTGKIITYTAITLGVIVIIGFGIFEIKKRVIDQKNR